MVRIYKSDNTFTILNLASSGGGAVSSVNGQTGAVVVDLQSATAEGDTTTTDIEITDNTKGIILKTSGGSRIRVTASDDGFGNAQLTLTTL